MAGKPTYYVLKEKAVPEVLLKVVEAKRLVDSGKVESVQEAIDAVGISRSSFYKYKDDIFPYHENAKGRTITMVVQLDDEPGLLSLVLSAIAQFHANILTIHQSVPVGGIASLTISLDVFEDEVPGENEKMVLDGVDSMKVKDPSAESAIPKNMTNSGSEKAEGHGRKIQDPLLQRMVDSIESVEGVHYAKIL